MVQPGEAAKCPFPPSTAQLTTGWHACLSTRGPSGPGGRHGGSVCSWRSRRQSSRPGASFSAFPETSLEPDFRRRQRSAFPRGRGCLYLGRGLSCASPRPLALLGVCSSKLLSAAGLWGGICPARVLECPAASWPLAPASHQLLPWPPRMPGHVSGCCLQGVPWGSELPLRTLPCRY